MVVVSIDASAGTDRAVTLTAGRFALHVSEGDARALSDVGTPVGRVAGGGLRWAGPAVLASGTALYLLVYLRWPGYFGQVDVLVYRFGAAGATALLLARSADKLDALVASITAGGGRAVTYPADLPNEDAVAAVTKQIAENHGPLDLVVSNAGKSIRRSIDQQYDRPQDFQRTIDINCLGARTQS